MNYLLVVQVFVRIPSGSLLDGNQQPVVIEAESAQSHVLNEVTSGYLAQLTPPTRDSVAQMIAAHTPKRLL